MITWQENSRFPYNMIAYLVRWSRRPIKLLLSDLLIMLVVMLTLVGGVFFWVAGFSAAFMSYDNNQIELESVRSSLQTMKRMVSQQVWSESVQEEYDKLFVAQPIKVQPAGDIYNDNFVRSN